jgi:SAM-dependent methyltransferase
MLRRLLAAPERLYERLQRIDTAADHPREFYASLRRDSAGDLSRNKDMTIYEPMFYDRINRILDSLRIGPQDSFVDLGCGKGRVVFACALLRVKRITGVELDHALMTKARENLGRLRWAVTRNIGLVEGDASEYAFTDETVVFAFNPFGAKTMVQVLANVRRSLDALPRRLRVVYFNPVHADVFAMQSWLRLERESEKKMCQVWVTRKA